MTSAALDRAWKDCPWSPRAWQSAALPVAIEAAKSGKRCVLQAVTGAGKSKLQAELVWCALPKLSPEKPAVVSVPSVNLVEQLSATFVERLGAEHVGRYYTRAKETSKPVIVCCNASMPKLAGALRARGARPALWVADEVHKTEALEIKDAAEALNPAARIGFTATPFRADKRESLSLWDKVVFRYLLANALDDGVLVPWRILNWDGGQATVDQACVTMVGTHAQGPGIVSANTIADAEAFAMQLEEAGIPARAVHSRLHPSEQASLIADLREGRLRALVHVALLAEGVDFPWLRWLCLRRAANEPSRVRFVQEIGRVLRVFEGKTEAVFLDPTNLFGRLGLAHREALGEAIDNDGQAPRFEPEEEGEDWDDGSGPRMAVVVSALKRFLRDMHLALEAAGKARPQQEWLLDGPPVGKQLQTLRNLSWVARRMPEPHRSFVLGLIERAEQFDRSVVSDTIAVLLGLADAKGQGIAWEKVNITKVRWS